MFKPCSRGSDRFPKQIVKIEFVKKLTVTYIMWEWASDFVLLYNDFVYDMYAPVVIQDKTQNISVINIL